jgi:glycosyltransferase involved in cell wall biosynthesis
LWDGAARFVDPLDDRAFADAITRLAGDEFLHRQMGEAARARAARYTPAAMAREMAALYTRLAAKADGGGRPAVAA